MDALYHCLTVSLQYIPAFLSGSVCKYLHSCLSSYLVISTCSFLWYRFANWFRPWSLSNYKNVMYKVQVTFLVVVLLTAKSIL